MNPSGPLFSCGRRCNQAAGASWHFFFSYPFRSFTRGSSIAERRGMEERRSEKLRSYNFTKSYRWSRIARSQPSCDLRTPRVSMVGEHEAINVKRETLETCRFRRNPTRVAHFIVPPEGGLRDVTDFSDKHRANQGNSRCLTILEFGDRPRRANNCNNRKATTKKHDCLPCISSGSRF